MSTLPLNVPLCDSLSASITPQMQELYCCAPPFELDPGTSSTTTTAEPTCRILHAPPGRSLSPLTAFNCEWKLDESALSRGVSPVPPALWLSRGRNADNEQCNPDDGLNAPQANHPPEQATEGNSDPLKGAEELPFHTSPLMPSQR